MLKAKVVGKAARGRGRDKEMTPEQLDMHKRLQPLYKRVTGKENDNDRFYSDKTGEYCDSYTYPKLLIPLTIDSEHPERGLWGMLDDVVSLKKHSHTITGVIEYWLSTKTTQFYADDPTTAILKALCEQEGV